MSDEAPDVEGEAETPPAETVDSVSTEPSAEGSAEGSSEGSSEPLETAGEPALEEPPVPPVPTATEGGEPLRVVSAARLRRRTRRDFLLFGGGAIATLAAGWFVLPLGVKRRMTSETTADWLDTAAARVGASRARSERFLNRALTFDDDVAEAIYSPGRRVRTYRRSDVTPLRSNSAGRTPGPEYLETWTLMLTGLAGGNRVLHLDDLLRMTSREQVTRLCCVEGWSGIAAWRGVPFAALLAAYPPVAGAKWAALESSVSLDGAGRRDPYYVSIDLATARHPQSLLATHLNGRPLGTDHGAPLRLVVPMKLGLKNIKAITKIAYTADEPRDYWAERGYSKYDGL